MPDSGNLTKDGHSVQYIQDAFKERLPHNWTVSRSEGPSIDGFGTLSGFYKWVNWSSGTECVVEVHEAFAAKIGVDALCDFVMLQVEEAMNDPLAKFTTPRWKKGLAPIPVEMLLKMAAEEQQAIDAATAEYERTH